MTAKEAYRIAKKNGEEYTSYSEFDDKYIFCMGDPNYWYGVDKTTGEVEELSYVGSLGLQAIFGAIDDDYFDNFSKAIKSSRPITELQ